MKLFVSVLLTLLAVKTMTNFKIDFGLNKGGQDWYVVNDDVMGGRSSSSIKLTPTSMVFSGTVSLENNGGFASVRSARKNLDLSGYKSLTIRFRSTTPERKFSLRLNTNDVYYRPSYNSYFQALTIDWQEASFDLTDFNKTIMGRHTGEKMTVEALQNVLRIGIMLNDKKQGVFHLEVDAITLQ